MDDIERYYEILGLKPGASQEKLKEAFRDLVKVWHPDRFSHDPKLQKKAQEKLKEINLAYQRLESFVQDHGVHSSKPPPKPQPPPKPEPKQRNQFRPRPNPPRPPAHKKKDFIQQTQSALIKFESTLRGALLIFGYRLPPLTLEGRIKALLVLLGAVYFVVIGIYLVLTRI
ncbi:MAG TPA: J domain-containing protein [Candidatus Binatia bacterium]|jgi:hypothetical protein|nr:J domain-containing protein [Candidatus Binatia bacterium]